MALMREELSFNFYLILINLKSHLWLVASILDSMRLDALLSEGKMKYARNINISEVRLAHVQVPVGHLLEF